MPTEGAAPAGIDFAEGFSGAVWCDILPRFAVRPELPPRVLLHAGPPFRGAPPAPVVNAAVQALLFEGLAADEAEARRLLTHGDIRLEPAQDHGIVTPLAQVVSASMLLGAVRHHTQMAYGALLEGNAPALRFGTLTRECRQRLTAINGTLRESVASCVRRAPIALDEIIRSAVAAHEECHSRTAAANQALIARIDGLDPHIAVSLSAVPAFVLPLLMAGAAAAVRHHCSSVEALGGNGVDFGIRRRGEPTWRQVPAHAPRGAAPGGTVPGGTAPDGSTGGPVVALPAVGDSVLVDFCGLGGLVDAPALRMALVDPSSGIIDAAQIAALDLSPAFNLAVLDSAGMLGMIGRGIYHPPVELFVQA